MPAKKILNGAASGVNFGEDGVLLEVNTNDYTASAKWTQRLKPYQIG
jgi:hypothetical protein